MQIAYLLAMAVLGASLCLYVIQLACVYHHTRRRPAPGALLEPISILKPLCGKIDGLRENLDSFARLNYPRFEIILGVKCPKDTALPVARDFQKCHPGLPIKIIINDHQFGWNPKINNLVPMMMHAAHDLILISDDNVRVEADYLRDTMAEMKEDTGLVYNLIRGTNGARFGAILENLHLNSFIAGSVCFLQKMLRHPCVIGKSMLMRRSTLQRIGGFETVRNALAEDYLLGKHFQSQGYRVALSPHRVSNVNINWSFQRFVNRHARWAKMRFWIGTYRYAGEWLGNPIACSLIALIIQPEWFSVFMLAMVCIDKTILDWLMSRRLTAEIPFRHFLLMPIKDLIIAIAWFAPFINRTIVWRDKKFTVSWGSRLRPFEEKRDEEMMEVDPLPVLS